MEMLPDVGAIQAAIIRRRWEPPRLSYVEWLAWQTRDWVSGYRWGTATSADNSTRSP